MKSIPIRGLSETQWQDLRSSLVSKGMVGGTDSGTLMGINKYKSSINLYYQAVGINDLPNKMNAPMLHGKQLESYVGKCWQYWDGTDEGWIDNTMADNKIKKYAKVNSILINPKYPFLFANIDGKITKHPVYGKKSGVLEIKTISGFSADSYEGGIPPAYLIQLQHYLLVTGYKYGEIVYLKDGRDLGCLTFEADKELQDRILEAAELHYNRVRAARLQITPDMPEDLMIEIASMYEPSADNSQAFNEFLSAKHRARAEELTMIGNDEHQSWAIDYSDYNEKISAYEEGKRLYQNRLKQVMEQNKATIMMLPNGGKITWRKQFNIKW